MITLNIGDKYGKLTIIQHLHGSYYKCKCDCGNEIEIIANRLTSGHRKTCGKCKGLDIVNKTFGTWEVLEKTNMKNKSNYFLYKCKCIKCGNISYRTSSQIKKNIENCNNCKVNDYTGKQFNKLTVLKDFADGSRQRKCECLCECGNIVIVQKNNLQSGTTKSCGCLKVSGGEEKIEKILIENNINYEKQKIFPGCIFKSTGANARFDFYLPDYNTVIEYDGQQHFEPRTFGNISKEKAIEEYNKTKERDAFKTKWCEKNNINLIRIPYTSYNHLDLEHLLP